MYPVLLEIDPITISSLWICLALGFFVSLIVINKLIKQRLVKLSFLANHSLMIFLSGLITSRLVFILRNYKEFFHELSFNKILGIFSIWDKGLSIWGGFIGLFIAIYLLCKKEQENFFAWADIIIVSIISGMVLGNIGTFLDGRNSGTPTSLPWGITLETSQYATPIHPIQIYAAIYSLILATILMILFNKRSFKKEGNISLIGIFLYSLLRFFDEFLRGDETNTILGLREVQIYCLFAIFITAYFIYQKIKHKELTF